jgi:hypothetical protein
MLAAAGAGAPSRKHGGQSRRPRRLLVKRRHGERISTVGVRCTGTAVELAAARRRGVLLLGLDLLGLDPALGIHGIPSRSPSYCGPVLIGVPSGSRQRPRNDGKQPGRMGTKTPCSQGVSGHRRRSGSRPEEPCQGGGRGFESRRPLQNQCLDLQQRVRRPRVRRLRCHTNETPMKPRRSGLPPELPLIRQPNRCDRRGLPIGSRRNARVTRRDPLGDEAHDPR